MNPRSLRMDTEFERKPWSERVVLFVIAFIFWLLLAWPVGEDGHWLWIDVGVGAAMAVLVALVMRSMFRQNFVRLLNLRCWFWIVVYLFVFGWHVLKGGFDVVYRVLHPAMPIRPGIVRARSTLETDTARIVLANSITLTPGTLSVDVTPDGVFYVHWLNVISDRDEEAAELILRHFEWFIRRIFE
ncbi:MAG: Na+/H+ antiporter subunit E [Xanthomonadales bacterium]|nr:Na+/H+ antiporter subunit E [Gammaproteobacteria bacterium]MBT8050807.1 Na+/H+ antiporter subunit E [Gammaproteobacteria bacterium]NNJ79548.1 Na+/H+ antiporter subunit E [Xanthomonadales bacterium]NNK37068.1 Na+/H+ antiporter subunit E [Xanthomonadales bacterium]